MSREGDLEELIRSAFESMIKGVWTAMPCIVVSINLSQQRADVKPLINQLNRDGSFSERSLIYGVPIAFQASSTSAFTFPVNEGDTVLCVFSMRGLDAFKEGDGTESNPVDFSTYSQKDAMAIPGLFAFEKANNNPELRTLVHDPLDCVVAHNIGTDEETEIRMKPDGKIVATSPSEVEINCTTANVKAANVNLGEGGAAIARVGDAVSVTVVGGSSAGSHAGTITAGSPNNTST